MRSLFLILGTAAALVCAFALYVHMASPPGAGSDGPETAAPISAPTTDGQTYMAGAWSNLYDKDGQLYGRLRSKQCVPAADGMWHLTEPEADFYQHDGQIANLTARDGDVRLGQQTHNETLGNGPVDPPSQGTLNDVTVRLFSDAAAEQAGDAEMTLHMDNTRFDADTYRLYTVAANGLSAEEIPITVRGRQMDFDGSGLLLEWNGQAHALKSLVVSHEKSMRLRQQAEQPATRPARQAASGKKAATPVHVYLATFEGGVHVTQNGQERISAPVMTVMLASGSATRPADGKPAASPGGEPPKSNETPIDVLWGGEARIVPAVLPAGSAMAAGQSIIRFWGGRVLVSEDTMRLIGTDVSYDNASQAGVAAGSADEPLRMTFLNKQGKDSGTVVTAGARYWQRDNRVELGPGAGKFADPNKAGDVMNAAWAEACNLTLGGSGEHLEIQHAELIGDAMVRDGPAGGADKLKLTAQRIDTNFARQAAPPANGSAKAAKAPAEESVLRRLTARTNASCVIHGDKEADRAISGDALTVEMAEDGAGKAYPHFVTASGNVHAQQEGQELWARRLDATVRPVSGKGKTDESHYQMQTMVADGDVKLRGKNGETGTGEILTVEEHDNQSWIRLVGQPLATVTSDKRTLSGHELELRPNENWAEVSGAGSVEGLAAARAGKADQPIHARWNTSATVLGNDNKIDILGGVEADTTESTGVKNTMLADHAILTLAAKPATRPTKVAAMAAAKDDSPGGMRFDPFKDKQVQLVTLLEHASLESTLLAADGAISRRAFIEGARIDADVAAQNLVVPGPGRMLLEEHRKRNDAEKTPVSGQGTTAFSWVKQFTYDQAAHRAVIDGSVNIKHLPDAPKADPTSLVADEVTADFEATGAAEAAGAPVAAADSEPRLKEMRAEGHVLIQSGTKLIEAARVTYDPLTQLLTIDGPPGGSVVITDTKTNGQDMCDEATVNVRTNEFKAVNVRGNGRR